MIIKQKLPSQIYDDWQDTIESIQIVLINLNNFKFDVVPSWAENLSINEIEVKVDNLILENNYQYTLNLIAAIEGLFNHQIKFYVKNKVKSKEVKQLRSKFKKDIKKDKYIKFETILDEWKNVDPRIKTGISKLKEFLKYRHWFAHGRHWAIQYRNFPDPNDIFLLYEQLHNIIVFDLKL